MRLEFAHITKKMEVASQSSLPKGVHAICYTPHAILCFMLYIVYGILYTATFTAQSVTKSALHFDSFFTLKFPEFPVSRVPRVSPVPQLPEFPEFPVPRVPSSPSSPNSPSFLSSGSHRCLGFLSLFAVLQVTSMTTQ